MLEKVADIIARALKPKLHNPSPTTMVGGQTGPGQYSWRRANPAPPVIVKGNRIPAKPTTVPTATPTQAPLPTAPPAQTTVPMPTATPPPATPGKPRNNPKLPHADIIYQWWGDASPDADRILAGENSRRQTGPEIDIPNRIDPLTGKWSDTAPIMKRKNPLTGLMIDSIDRGLFRINNITLYDYMKRYPKLLEQNDIHGWDDMLDPVKNTRFAKIIYDTQGIKAWYGAK